MLINLLSDTQYELLDTGHKPKFPTEIHMTYFTHPSNYCLWWRSKNDGYLQQDPKGDVIHATAIWSRHLLKHLTCGTHVLAVDAGLHHSVHDDRVQPAVPPLGDLHLLEDLLPNNISNVRKPIRIRETNITGQNRNTQSNFPSRNQETEDG